VSPTRVIIIGAGDRGRGVATELLNAGLTDVVTVPANDDIASVYDDDTDTWTLSGTGDQNNLAEVVIAAEPRMLVPWIPELAGHNDFRGTSFHAAQWDTDFDPSGKHIAVIGADSSAGHYLGQLTAAATSVTVFAHPPRRIVAEMPLPPTRVKRWLGRQTRAALGGRQSPPALVASAICAITPSGVRTSDGVDHQADAIIYGTGFTVSDRSPKLLGAGGLSLEQTWIDGTEPFLGVAIHGFPNYFLINGPDVGGQIRYVVECLRLRKDSGSARIELLRSSQQVFNERAHLRPAAAFRAASAFDLSSGAPSGDQTYDGMATLTIAGASHPVRVRLAGHLDPIDGRYHWQGTLFSSPGEPLPDDELRQIRTATLTVGERSATARIVEQTPWGTHAVAGVGAPPYAMAEF
jgi:cation diffusion facilitator CzcD-associated flavoprotein CzcO